MQSELDDLKFRLDRGEQFDEFLSDTWDTLFHCKYSREKWLHLRQPNLTAPLEFYHRALKANQDIIYLVFYVEDPVWIANMILSKKGIHVNVRQKSCGVMW